MLWPVQMRACFGGSQGQRTSWEAARLTTSRQATGSRLWDGDRAGIPVFDMAAVGQRHSKGLACGAKEGNAGEVQDAKRARCLAKDISAVSVDCRALFQAMWMPRAKR